MKPQIDFSYDAFLSYASEDSEWAELVESMLSNKGYNVFLDKKRLIAGSKWENELTQALYESNHMIVLWSSNANKSQWVRREIHTFLAKCDLLSREEKKNQLVIFINLEGENQAYNSYHMLNHLKDGGYYPGRTEDVNQTTWDDLLFHIERSLSSDLHQIVIPTIVMTMTQDELDKLDPSTRPNDFSPSFSDLLTYLNINRKEDIEKYYGTKRSDWKLFATDRSLASVLDEVTQEMNQVNQKIRFAWQEISPDFWTGDYLQVKQTVVKLMNDPVFVFIDPLSLYISSVSSRINVIEDILDNPQAAIIVPSPVQMPHTHSEVRNLMRNMAYQFFNRFYGINNVKLLEKAYCDLNINDDLDIRRSILTALAPLFIEQELTPVSNFLRV